MPRITYSEIHAVKKSRLILISLPFWILITCACQALTFPIDIQPASSGDLLFQDDFSDISSGWTRLISSMDGNLEYKDGAYHISVDKSELLIWGGPGLNFSDVRLEVDVVNVAGPSDNDFGLVCRSKDRKNFYYFVISSDGYYGIGKVVNSVQELINMDKMLPSESINRGQSRNHIRADCVEDMLSLYVNGDILASVKDAQFSSGEVGLLAGTFQNPGIEVNFDNFLVLRP